MTVWTEGLLARAAALRVNKLNSQEIAKVLSEELGAVVTKASVNGALWRRSLDEPRDRSREAGRRRSKFLSVNKLTKDGRLALNAGGSSGMPDAIFIRRHVPRTIRKILPDNRVELYRQFGTGKITRDELSRQLWGGA